MLLQGQGLREKIYYAYSQAKGIAWRLVTFYTPRREIRTEIHSP